MRVTHIQEHSNQIGGIMKKSYVIHYHDGIDYHREHSYKGTLRGAKCVATRRHVGNPNHYGSLCAVYDLGICVRADTRPICVKEDGKWRNL